MRDLTPLSSKEILTSSSVKDYYIENLLKLNEKLSDKIIKPAIIYSADVLERYLASEMFFEKKDGKTRHKILGVKLLEAQGKSQSKQKETYQEVAETSLVVSGYFYKSHKRSLLSRDYYIKLGQSAFLRYGHFQPDYFQTPDFFKYMANFFERISKLIYLATIKNSLADSLDEIANPESAYLLGIHNTKQDKAS